MNRLEQAINEYIIEDEQRLQNKFLDEIEMEHEVNDTLPFNIVFLGQELNDKWIEMTRLN